MFRLGIAVILLALMFPIVEAVDKYVGTGTSVATFFLWLFGAVLVFASAFTTDVGRSRGSSGSGS